MLAEQKMTSDGITSESLLAIYRAMYHRFDVLREKLWVRLLLQPFADGRETHAG